jgi:hypothetical protein
VLPKLDGGWRIKVFVADRHLFVFRRKGGFICWQVVRFLARAHLNHFLHLVVFAFKSTQLVYVGMEGFGGRHLLVQDFSVGACPRSWLVRKLFNLYAAPWVALKVHLNHLN